MYVTRIRVVCIAILLLVDGLVKAQDLFPERIEVPIYYDPSNGNLTIDGSSIPGGRFSGYSLDFNYDGLGPFDPGRAGLQPLNRVEFTPFMGTVWSDITDWSIGEVKLEGNGVPAGVYSIGNIMPVGLARDETEVYAQAIRSLRPSDPLSGGMAGITGTPGDGYFHFFDFIYGKSPFPPLNVGDEWDGPRHERWAESASLLYDPADGGVSIDLTGARGGAVAGFELLFNDESVKTDQWQPVGELSTFAHGRMSEFFSAGLSEGIYDLGAVLPSGLSPVGLEDALISARFIGEPGHYDGPFNIDVHGQSLNLRIIPEPTGLWQLTAWLAVFAMLRRRWRLRWANGE